MTATLIVSIMTTRVDVVKEVKKAKEVKEAKKVRAVRDQEVVLMNLTLVPLILLSVFGGSKSVTDMLTVQV